MKKKRIYMLIIFGILVLSFSFISLVNADLCYISGFNVMFDATIVGEDPSSLGDYSRGLSIFRELPNGSQGNLSISGPPQIIKISKISYNKDKLNISYTFDNTNIIGNAVSVEIWVTDDQNKEVVRGFDVFPITKEGLIQRNVLIDAPNDLAGNYYIYFALSGYLEDYISQLIVIVGEDGAGEKPGNKTGDSDLEKVSDIVGEDSGNKSGFLTGKTVGFLQNPEFRSIGYSVIVLLIMIAAFLIMRSSWKKAFKEPAEPPEPAKPAKPVKQAATGYALPHIPLKKHPKAVKGHPKAAHGKKKKIGLPKI